MTPELSEEISAPLLDISGIAETVADWRRRDEAWGRMLSATAEGDDEAYELAKRDFWNPATKSEGGFQ